MWLMAEMSIAGNHCGKNARAFLNQQSRMEQGDCICGKRRKI